MKYVKILGLASLAVLAFMAVAAASASANAKVCSTVTGSPNTEIPNVACNAGHGVVYSGPFSGTGTATLTATNSSGSSVATVTCTSTSGGTVNGTTGTGTITSLTFTGCSSPSCPNGVTASSNASAANNYKATATTEIAGTENTNGILDVSVGTAEPTGQFDCNVFGIHTICKFKTSSAQLKIDGSDTAPALTATNIALTKEEGPESLCGVKADWTAAYNKSVTPSSIFIE